MNRAEVLFKFIGAFMLFICFINIGCRKSSTNEIQIGSQLWMTQNLNTQVFNNGDSIFHAKTQEDWDDAEAQSRPAWCFYSNDPLNGQKFGLLYNWHAVNDMRGLAPKGWHIPSDKEWLTLIDFLGGKESAGFKLKATKGWTENGVEIGNGSDESGFNALPAGKRYWPGGEFSRINSQAMWWTATEQTSVSAFYVWLQQVNHISVTDHSSEKGNGYSVRCIADTQQDLIQKETQTNSTIDFKSIEISLLGVSHYNCKKLLGDPDKSGYLFVGNENKLAWVYKNKVSDNGTIKHLVIFFRSIYGVQKPRVEDIKAVIDGEKVYYGIHYVEVNKDKIISNSRDFYK